MGRLTDKDWKNPQSTMWAKVDLHIKNPNYNVGVSRALQKLAEYEDLEEQGRLIELPCAVGDTVWMVIDNRDFKRRMKDYCLSAEELPDLNIAEHNFNLLLLSSIGKTVFLTKEEAEAKLKELEG